MLHKIILILGFKAGQVTQASYDVSNQWFTIVSYWNTRSETCYKHQGLSNLESTVFSLEPVLNLFAYWYPKDLKLFRPSLKPSIFMIFMKIYGIHEHNQKAVGHGWRTYCVKRKQKHKIWWAQLHLILHALCTPLM